MNKIFFLIFLCSSIYANENWQEHWHSARELYSLECFQDAAIEFDKAVSLMNEEEYELYPFVFADRAENEFYLGNYLNVLSDTEKALKSPNLTETERLLCGSRRSAVFMKLDDEESAIEEYNKYISNSPICPKYNFSKEKIIIRNVPDNKCYTNVSRKFLVSNFCQSEDDLYEYGNVWVVNITKDNSCKPCEEKANTTRRSPERVRACCNTCNKLAVGANIICGCVSGYHPVHVLCRIACLYFVEELRQTCESCCYHGGIEEKCWKKFEMWKADYKDENPTCPQPPRQCPK